MQKTIKKIMAALSIGIATPILAFAAASAETASIIVTQDNTQGWVFNGDPSTATPYEFTEDQASIGDGSLFVPPIGENADDKFIAALPLGTPVTDFGSISYDFLIAGNGDMEDANEFYLNVYTNLAGSASFYDCRYDYVPTTGLTTEFTTATFNAANSPADIGDNDLDEFVCPATLDEMPEDSTISFIALNVGDTSTNDVGLAGYLDNVVIANTDASISYNFELDQVQAPIGLTNKEDCKNGGWSTSEEPLFKNQGDCVSHFASDGRSNGNPVVSFLRGLF